MYTYTMERTQIYLGRRETATLDRIARETGRTRSQLIRDAIAATYLPATDRDSLEAALEATAGLWADRSETGEAYVDRIRPGLGERLRAQDDR